jgi:hypothetical protein
MYNTNNVNTAMNRKNRLKALKVIEAEAVEENVDQNKADSNNLSTENYGHQIFQELLQNLYIEELDS